MEALEAATEPLAWGKEVCGHTMLVLKYPEDTPQTQITEQLRLVPGLQWRVSGSSALVVRQGRRGILKNLVVRGRKPQLRRPKPLPSASLAQLKSMALQRRQTILDAFCQLGPEVTNMAQDGARSSTFVPRIVSRCVDEAPLETFPINDLRVRVFVAEFDVDFSQVRHQLEALALLDPDLIWDAKPGPPVKALIIRGPTCPRRVALQVALQNAKLSACRGSVEKIRQLWAQRPRYWTNACSDAPIPNEGPEQTWSCPETADLSAPNPSA